MHNRAERNMNLRLESGRMLGDLYAGCSAVPARLEARVRLAPLGSRGASDTAYRDVFNKLTS